MKKDNAAMRTEYRREDFPRLQRGRFFDEVAAGTTVVLLEPEVARAFPDSAAVNKALRELMAGPARTPRKPAAARTAKAPATK